ncbi:MAG: PDZ domain-containing protein [Planctomycetota bacterium]
MRILLPALLAASVPGLLTAAQEQAAPSPRVPGWRAALERVNERVRGSPIAWLDGHMGVTSRLRMSPDGNRAVTWAQDGSAWLWNAWTGEPIGLLGMFEMGETSFRALGRKEFAWPELEFSSDGERILLLERLAGLAGLWDGRSAEFLGYLEVGEELAREAAFTPDGRRVAVANESGTIRWFDAASGLQSDTPGLEAIAVNELTFSPDGSRVLALTAQGRARVFDARSGALEGELGSEELPLRQATFSSDGTRILGACAGGLALVARLDAPGGGPLRAALVDGPSEGWLVADWCVGWRIDGRGFPSAPVYPRGDRLFVLTREGDAVLWDPDAGQAVAQLEGIRLFADSFAWVGFSRDGERLVTLQGDRNRLWNAVTGELVAELPYRAEHATFAPSGRYFATAPTDLRSRQTAIYDTQSGELASQFSMDNSSVFAVHFSDNDRLGASSGFGWASVWDGDRERVALAGHALMVAEDGLDVGLPHWSPNGVHAVSPSWGRRTWFVDRTWDAHTGLPLADLPTGAFGSGGFLSNGELLTLRPCPGRTITTVQADGPAAKAGLLVGDRIVKLGERPVDTSADLLEAIGAAPTSTTVRVVRDGAELELALELPPDAKAKPRLALGALDEFGARAEILDPVSGSLSRAVELQGAPREYLQQALVNRDATRLLARSERSGVYYDLQSGERLGDFSTARTYLQSTYAGRVHLAAMNDGGDVVAAAREDGVVLWTDAPNDHPARLTGNVLDLDISADGRKLAGASPEGRVLVWDVATASLLATLTGHRGGVRFVEFDSAGQRVVSTGVDGTARIFDIAGSTPPRVLEGHAGLLGRASFSPDGTRVLTVGDDGTARIWDASTGALVALLEAHLGPVTLGEFSPDGTRILTQAMDASTRLWSGADGRLLATRVEYEDGWFLFEPGGHYMAGGNGAEHAQIVVSGRRYPMSSYASIYESPAKVAESLAGKAVRAPAFVPQAPELRVASPLDPRITERTFRLEVLIEDVYGIESVGVVQDDRALDAKWIGERLVRDGKTVRLSCDLALPEGVNQTTVRVRATNVRKIQSAPRTVLVRWEKPQRELFVLAMGVADYRDDRLDLAYPVKDVDDLIARFAAEEGGDYRRVHAQRLVDGEVTPGRLRKAREEFLLRAQPDDTIVVFAAGHGVRSESGEYYFLPSGSTPQDPYDGIERQALESLVTWDRLHARRRVLLLDTCHSGEAFDAGKRGVAADAFDQKSLDEAAGTGLYIIAASSEQGFAQETTGNGLFTRCLLEGLDGAADANGDGRVGIEELRIFATAAVHERSGGRQRPTAPRIEGGEDFPLVRKSGNAARPR